jgi:hypothetical protein
MCVQVTSTAQITRMFVRVSPQKNEQETGHFISFRLNYVASRLLVNLNSCIHAGPCSYIYDEI